MFNNQLWRKKPWFVVFTNFPGVDTPTTTNFKLSAWDHSELGRDTKNQFSWARMSQLQHIAAYYPPINQTQEIQLEYWKNSQAASN